ncbi:hypothetical protein CBR_g78690 [Chara braunii]|uniref:Uncharacterized protein n=1 Tax=Chara braunii TaxID=69332 RepID=A0A388JKU5_CHABU|nr:hypothetical protein CBR_g78690 [Chara braunii]|eukprot:GBG45250.1 hypothetical protein CBR_g78690 [Chara braunii]
MRNKRGAAVVTETSQPEESPAGKQRADPSTTTMYTPKDLEALRKAYKAALVGKEMAIKEAEKLKERMANMDASRVRISTRKTAMKKTTPRNLKMSFYAVEVEADEEGKEKQRESVNGRLRSIVDVTHDLEVAKMAGFRESMLKELRRAKKQDMEEICMEEGITYIKLNQAKADVAEIKASRNYAAWLKEKDKEPQDEDNADQQYATSNEDAGDE